MMRYLKRILHGKHHVPVIKRVLTDGEIAMAKHVFADGLNYDSIHIHNAPFLPFGMQNSYTVMAPNGNIYFPKGLYSRDYSNPDPHRARNRHLFIHEMVHVWQYQMGYRVKLKGMMLHPWGKLIRRNMYTYTLDSTKKLCHYNMEQQADIIADYYALHIDTSSQVHKSNSIIEIINEHGKEEAEKWLQEVLSDFLNNPSERSCLFK